MDGDRKRLKGIQAARRLLQNPCAYIEDVEEEKAKIRHSALYLSGDPYASLAEWEGDDDEATISLAEALQRPWPALMLHPLQEHRPKQQLVLGLRRAQQRGGNPYATLAKLDGDDELGSPLLVVGYEDPVTTTPKTFREFLSKTDFRSECIRIFLPYVPPHLPRRIPQHQRDFIARNERRSGKARYRLVESLRRYDLSTTFGIAPQFNREHSQGLSEKKLRQLESQVVDD